MSEYSVVVTDIDLSPDIEKVTSDQLDASLTMSLNQIVQKTSKVIQTHEGGGWEIISHELTRLGNRLVVSFLLRR